MAVDKLQRVQQLMSRVPVLNEEAQARLAAGQQMQLQQLAASTPAKQLTTRAIQAIAPQATQQFGQQQLQQQAQATQTQLGLAEQGLQQQAAAQQQQQQQAAFQQQAAQQQAELTQGVSLARQEEAAKNRLTDAEIASSQRLNAIGIETDKNISFLSTKQREDLANLGRDVKAKVFDSRLQFERDEAGRKFSNERQLMDFAVTSAKNQVDLQNKMQIMEQTATREILMMEIAANKINTALKQGYLDSKRELDQSTQAKLAEMKAQLDKDIAKKRAQANNMKMLAGGAMVLAGAGLTVASAGAGSPVGMAMMSGGIGVASSGAGGQ